MPTPSLVNIPFITAPNVLFSQIPESGAGDFTVTRTTSPVVGQSTRVNAAGLIELVADNVPRLDYPLGGAVNGCPALLVEPSARNDCFQSQGFNNSPWIAAGVSAVSTALTNSPDGTQNAFDVTISNTGFSNLRQFVACANNTTYTISCFYKNKALNALQTFEMRYTNENLAPDNLNAIATIDLAAGTATFAVFGTSGTGFSGTATGRVENYGNGWYRVSMTFTVGSAGANANGIFRPVAGISVTRNFFAWGAQMEVGSVPTSYIPTTTAAVTRGVETVSKTGVSSLIGQTEGTIYLEVDAPSASSQFFRINVAVTNAIHIYKNASDRYQVRIYPSASLIDLTDTSAKSGFVKIAIAYKSGESALVINGGSPITSATAYSFSAALSTVNFLGGVFSVLPTRIRAAAIYPNRISNLRLEFLTAPVTYTTYAQMANALSYILP